MYYNLKIITKDSELGLESTDKAIIEREMDIYFARIFGASTEFISQIQPAKIQKTQISVSNDIQTDIQEKKIEITQGNIQKEENEVIQDNIYIAENKIDTAKKIELDNIFGPATDIASKISEKEETKKDYSTANQTAINNIFFSQETETESKLEQNDSLDVKENNFETYNNQKDENIVQEVEPISNENELEKEAQALYEQLKNEVKEQIKAQANSNPVIQDVKIEKQEEIIQQHTQNQIQEPMQTATAQDNVESQHIKPEAKQDESSQDNINSNSSFEIMPDVTLEENNNNTQTDINTEVSRNIDEPVNISQNNSTPDSHVENTMKTSENIINPSISLDSFLSGFNVSDIHDEFLICASYLKNILKQNDFNIKTINSSLFRVTGKIADTSVVDELIQKEYINIVNSDDFVKYTISPKGEEYLAAKLPG